MIYILQRDSLLLGYQVKTIAYIRFGNSPKSLPVSCNGYEISKDFKDFVHFQGVTSLSDNYFENFVVDELLIPISKIVYIVNGSLSEESEVKDEEINLDNKLDDLWSDE